MMNSTFNNNVITAKTFVTLVAFTGGTLGMAWASPILTTDFESPAYNLGNMPTTVVPVTAGSNDDSASVLNESTATPFGAGPNQFIALTGTLGQNSIRAISVSTLATYYFNLFEPAGASGTLHLGISANDLNAAGAFTGWTINNGAFGLGSNTSLASGSLPALSIDTHYIAHVLYNGSGTSQSIANSSEILAAGQTALFFWDVANEVYIDGGRYSHTATVTPTRFMFRTFSSSANTIYIDDFTHDNTLLLVPEPTTLSMLLVGVAALGVARRGRNRAQ